MKVLSDLQGVCPWPSSTSPPVPSERRSDLALVNSIRGMDPSFLIDARHGNLLRLSSVIDGGIHGHPIKISVKAGFALESVDGTIEFDKNFLNDIKGILPMSHHAIGDSIDLLTISVEDLLQCILVSLLQREIRSASS